MLKEQVAIITGGASGIGLGIATRLINEGVHVALFDISPTVLHLADYWHEQGNLVSAQIVDISNIDEVKVAVQKVIDQFHKVNILVNCVGISAHAELTDENASEKWKKVIDTNLHGTYYLTNVVSSQMKKNGWYGNIINITSVHSRIPVRFSAHYPSSKAAIRAFTKSAALELAEHGIRVNAIAPGAISNTGMNPLVNTNDESRSAALQSNIPLERYGTPDEIAKTVVFLIDNEYITGQEIVVDGGLSLNH
jgi:3-oxoacyl-[acyl-carrier protein] reductase